jgi:hypothetical protein
LGEDVGFAEATMQLFAQISWPAVVALCLGTSAAVLANMISFVMIGKINGQLPPTEHISYVFWGTPEVPTTVSGAQAHIPA